MVNVIHCKKCATCNNCKGIPEDTFGTCQLKGHKVWKQSVACRDYDDTVIF